MDLQILYADTLFLSNFIMNLLSLSLTGTVMHIKYKKRRLCFSAALGGIYSVLAVVLSFPGALHIAVGILLSALLTGIAFGNESGGIGFFLRTFLLFYFSSVLLGGGIDALFSVLEDAFGMRTDLLLRPADAVLIVGFSVYFALRGITGLLSTALPHSVNVRVIYGERSVTVPLLVDSGCSLKDPISGRGAILVSADALRSILPPEILRAAREKGITIPNDPSLAARCRLLPMRGVGDKKLLLAFRPHGVFLLTDGGSLDVWVALYHGKEASFGGCRGLLPSGLLYGRVNGKKIGDVKR